MPRFFFHVYDGANLLDHEGVELDDLAAVETLAIRYAGEVLQNDAAQIQAGQNWSMEVTDETGLILLRLDLSVAWSAAVTDRTRPPIRDARAGEHC